MKQAGNIFRRKWLDCERCGMSYPVTKMIRQNGRLICVGVGTAECADTPGYQHYRKRVVFPLREGIDDDPRGNEVVD